MEDVVIVVIKKHGIQKDNVVNTATQAPFNKLR